MKLLSFYLGWHDSNLCLYDTRKKELQYFKPERLSGVKHEHVDWAYVENFCASLAFEPDAVCFSDGGRNNLGSCQPDAAVTQMPSHERPAYRKASWYNLDHHLAHILSTWPVEPLDEVEIGIAIDGRGDHDRRISVFSYPARLEPPIWSETGFRVGDLLNHVGLKLGLAGGYVDQAGKVMGAQAYGTVDEIVARCWATDFATDPLKLLETPVSGSGCLEASFYHFASDEFRDWLATAHLAVQYMIQDIFAHFCTPSAKIAYSGGCALNTVVNQALSLNYQNLHIPPHCYDGGISLGCLEALRRILGLEQLGAGEFPYIQSDHSFGEATTATIATAAELLAGGAILGWLQGNGEVGPRALGHRSIIVSPMSISSRDHLNNRAKHREPWRPFGPAIQFEIQSEYCTDSKFSPYMLRAVPVTSKGAAAMPAVVHVDGSSRIQSVDANKVKGSESFAGLIEEFRRITGVGALLNTSFNLGGKPIVGTEAQAQEFFRTADIDALVIGNEIIMKNGRG